MKGFHLFKCLCDAVNPIMESQLALEEGEEKLERELVAKNAQFCSSFSGCVRSCHMSSNLQLLSLVKKTKWRFSLTASWSLTSRYL